MEFNLIAAIDVARRAHSGQKRKYTGEPYIVHPFSVAGLVSAVSVDEDMICAAILHDVVEDSNVTINTIRGIFGLRIAQMVDDLTDVSRPEDGNRKIRKKIDLEHTAKASVEAKTIKLADLIDNSRSILQFDEKFSKVFMREKRDMLCVLKEGNNTLFNIANKIVEDYFSCV